MLHFIPVACPHLDPIERLWGLMHKNITHNKCYAKYTDLLQPLYSHSCAKMSQITGVLTATQSLITSALSQLKNFGLSIERGIHPRRPCKRPHQGARPEPKRRRDEAHNRPLHRCPARARSADCRHRRGVRVSLQVRANHRNHQGDQRNQRERLECHPQLWAVPLKSGVLVRR